MSMNSHSEILSLLTHEQGIVFNLLRWHLISLSNIRSFLCGGVAHPKLDLLVGVWCFPIINGIYCCITNLSKNGLKQQD